MFFFFLCIELNMPPREEFPTRKLDGAPSSDIGWHFATPIPGDRNSVICKLCGKVVKGGITRLKQHIAHQVGNVAPCARVTFVVRENMMKILQDSKAKKIDSKKRKEEFEARLMGEDDEDFEGFVDHDKEMRHATQESIRAQREWEDRQRFREATGGYYNVFQEGGSSHTKVSSSSRQQLSSSDDPTFKLRAMEPELVRSQSVKQPKIKER
jgi:hypothetical protein